VKQIQLKVWYDLPKRSGLALQRNYFVVKQEDTDRTEDFAFVKDVAKDELKKIGSPNVHLCEMTIIETFEVSL